MSAWEEKKGADLEGKKRNSGGICNLKHHVRLSSSYSHPPYICADEDWANTSVALCQKAAQRPQRAAEF